ncbi:MAG: Bro-N domain-containing protein [Candidatus Firestonebacteria bacterium]
MQSDKNLIQFEGTKIRRYWDKQKEKWYFSVVDVVGVLSESNNPAVYWRVLKKRLLDEGSGETVTKCNGLKMVAADGKMRVTDIADTETMFRIIQSIPSPKAEPFKQWLAKVGYERLQDMGDPALSLDRARVYWQQLGRSEKWIQQRMMGQETRNKLTDYWKGHKITKEEEYAFLTNIIHKEWSDVTVKKHKEMKKLKTQNLRDHMSEAELIFTALAELSTRQIAETVQAEGLVENTHAAKKGGKIAKHARLQLEGKTGKSIITGENFLPPAGQKKKIK